MTEIIFATTNKNKLKEINKMISQENLNFKIISLDEANIQVDVIEDGETFESNALKKANEIMKISGKIVIADDSGLEIDFLDKAPGIYSARYLGENTPYSEKNEKILEFLKDVSFDKRTARFISVIAVAFPDGKNSITNRGTLEGYINFESAGENGFGYDPIFFIPKFNKTFAQMTLDDKNKISHRGIALRLTLNSLSGIL